MDLWVEAVDPEEATGMAKHFYETVLLGPDGEIPKLVRAWSLQADVADSWLKHRDSAVSGSGLDNRQFEVLLTRIVYNLKCAYVTRNHAWILLQQGHYTPEEVVQIVHDWQHSVLDDRDKALLAFGDKMCFGSHEVRQEDIEELRRAGFTDSNIVAIVFLVGWIITDAVVPNAFGLGAGDVWTTEMQAVVDWE